MTFRNEIRDYSVYFPLRWEYEKKYKSIRKIIFSQQKNECAYCGTLEDLTLDHIKPLRTTGNNDLDNFQILCRSCNRKKGAR